MGRTNIGSLFDAKESISHIKLFKMMKTYQVSIKQNTQQRGGGRYARWKDPSPGKRRIFQRGWIPRGIGTNQVLEPVPNCKMYIKYGVGRNT